MNIKKPTWPEQITIPRSTLEDLYSELREIGEGQGRYVAAVGKAIRFLFEELGEPGAGDE